MSDLIPFQFNGKEVRVEMDTAGEPWWVLQDCCSVLGLGDIGKAAARIDTDDKKKSPVIDTLGRTQDSWLINEPGLYTLLLRSNKPEAKAFRRWVTSDVLPTIRKTGHYEVPSLASDRYPELRAMKELIEAVADARTLAEQAELKANLALATQAWLTIEEYVYLHQLRDQFPPAQWADCGRYLTGYCQEHNIPIRNQPIAGKSYQAVHAYHVEVLHRLVPAWLTRRKAQPQLRVVDPKERPCS